MKPQDTALSFLYRFAAFMHEFQGKDCSIVDKTLFTS